MQLQTPNARAAVININSDLYSSDEPVLSALRDYIRVGTYLYFDEFCDPRHELKGFDEFISNSQAGFEIVAAYRDLSAAMSRRIV